jgi:magnesium-transporting ATPase (P-type)
MLTGDKMETAEEIAKSCNLIQPSYRILRFSGSSVLNNLDDWEHIKLQYPNDNFTLIIGGDQLSEIFANQNLAERFAKVTE